MSDEQGKATPKGEVRRVGKENRKQRLQAKPLAFPPDRNLPENEAQSPTEPETPEQAASDGREVPAAPPSPPSPIEQAATPSPAPSAPQLPDAADAEIDEETARFAPPTVTTEASTPPPPEPPAAIPSNISNTDTDDEEEHPTTQVRPVRRQRQDDRYPPVVPPRSLPPEIEQSPNLYPKPRTQTPKRVSRAAQIGANLVTVLIGLIIIGVGVYGAYIYRNPYSALNPLAPATPLPIIVSATFLPPTATTTPTFTPVAVGMVDVTEATAEPTALVTVDSRFVTPTLPGAAAVDGVAVAQAPTTAPVSDGSGPLVTFTPSATTPAEPTESPFAFVLLVPPGVVYTPNGNGRGCEWSSIAGTVVSLSGEPINGLGVRFTDQITQEVNTVFTGSSATFGEGGFEFIISSAPVQNGYTVQLFSPAGAPLSDELTVVSSDQCSQNVAVINFEQVKPY